MYIYALHQGGALQPTSPAPAGDDVPGAPHGWGPRGVNGNGGAPHSNGAAEEEEGQREGHAAGALEGGVSSEHVAQAMEQLLWERCGVRVRGAGLRCLVA